eukprot:3014198-Pyramimonas_sp.AAC.1
MGSWAARGGPGGVRQGISAARACLRAPAEQRAQVGSSGGPFGTASRHGVGLLKAAWAILIGDCDGPCGFLSE